MKDFNSFSAWLDYMFLELLSNKYGRSIYKGQKVKIKTSNGEFFGTIQGTYLKDYLRVQLDNGTIICRHPATDIEYLT